MFPLVKEQINTQGTERTQGFQQIFEQHPSLPSPRVPCSISVPRVVKSLLVNVWLWSGAEACGSIISEGRLSRRVRQGGVSALSTCPPEGGRYTVGVTG